jgi:hypothetical protein
VIDDFSQLKTAFKIPDAVSVDRLARRGRRAVHRHGAFIDIDVLYLAELFLRV